MPSNKVVEIVTKVIIEKLEQGIIPWRKPWTAERPCNYFSKRPYSGINSLILSCYNYERPYFVTQKAIEKEGGKLKDGITRYDGIPIVFYNFAKEMDIKTGKEVSSFRGMRFYTVFHISQCEGIKFELPELSLNPVNPIAQCEDIVNSYDIKASHGGDRACYIPSLDCINMPAMASFKDSEHYYRTYFHEMVHSTGHNSRLDRDLDGGMKTDSYAKEELIAELGAAMLCAECQIENHIDNSAAYIASWLKHLKDDRTLIIGASSKAEKAYTYILEGQDKDNSAIVEEIESDKVEA